MKTHTEKDYTETIMDKITIDIEAIRKQPNHSVTDYETIRQIAMYSIYNPNDREISDKVDPKFAFAGLYPFAYQY